MTYQEIIDKLSSEQSTTTFRRSPHDREHQLQVACVRWFSLQYPHLRGLLFAIPNGGRRDRTTAAKLKAEGVIAGVADLMLAMPSRSSHALFIEMKTTHRGSRQSDSQKEFQRQVTAQGFRYIVCRTLEEFINEINNYILHEQYEE